MAYNIPNRDCGLHSGGGAADAAGYQRWIDALARGIGAGPAAVILEPDALAANCLDPAALRQRLALLDGAVDRLAAQPGIAVYIDAGNPTWVPAPEIARRLRAAGVARARGFAINVSSFSTTPVSRAYGRAVSRRAGGRAVRHRHRTQRRRARRRATTGATPPAARWATGRPPPPATAWWTRCCGSSAPASRTAPATAGRRPGEWWADYALDLARAGVS